MWRADRAAVLTLGTGVVEYGVVGRGQVEGQSVAPIRCAVGQGAEGVSGQPDLVAALDQLVLAVEARAGDRPKAPLQVRVAHGWLAVLALPWSSALMQRESAEAFARAQLAAAGFDLAAGDRVCIDDAPFRAPRTVVAYPAALLNALEATAKRLDVALGSVQPLGLAVAATIGPGSAGALAVVEAGSVTLLRAEGRRHLPLGVPVPMQPDADVVPTVAQLWRRQQLRDPALANLSDLRVVDLRTEGGTLDLRGRAGLQQVAVPSDSERWRSRASEALDAVPQRSRPTAWAGAVALGTVVIAAVALFQAVGAVEKQRAQEASVAARTAPPPVQKKVARTREELARIAAVNVAVQELNLPIARLLAALQPPRDIRVALLGVEVQPARASQTSTGEGSVLKLSAESPSGADMARYVAFLADRKPFVSSYLVSHEIYESDPAKPYRFIVEAAWQE